MGDVVVIERDDPGRDDVRALHGRHMALMRATSPPEAVFALDIDGLRHRSVTFVTARDPDGALLGMGAIKELDPTHGELKSMHTAAEARGRGIGRQLVEHLLGIARARGYERVSLETGTMAEFAPARALYAAFGFEPCPPFAEYPCSPHSTCMTLLLDDPG